ncbi:MULTISPECIES: FtsB family cell division protein [unclassified Butyrivibrio]|uniref:FtsB family cell division protein n=1 Tax=unclassified Butyrivibrio TaxID=2639466 RepID=UPI0003B785F3|nr:MULTISPECIES: septum formation initiator family protein [unclassified Butyrivibrio]MDC7292729.1 septum formation initiator family protein [Butyrivibrio sp. DSM 10294]
MARRARYKRRGFQNKAGIILTTTVVLFLVVAVSIKGYGLKQKANELQEKEALLQQQIEEEQARSEDIAEFERYTHTRKYIEDTAKEKLGLVYPGEIIFKNTGN